MSHNTAAPCNRCTDAVVAATTVQSVMLQLYTEGDNESVCIMKGDTALHMLLDSSVKSDYFFNKQMESMQLSLFR